MLPWQRDHQNSYMHALSQISIFQVIHRGENAFAHPDYALHIYKLNSSSFYL